MSEFDGSIKFDTEIDTKGLSGQINKVSKEINKVSDNKTLQGFSKLGNAITGLKSAFTMVSGAASGALATLKSYNKFLTETTNAYNTQLKAEIQLRNAISNNPMIDGTGEKELEKFASKLQDITGYGDEVTISLMADLISNGRSVEETEELMGAAANYAAGTNTDLATAVSILNATYTGTIGTLGRQNQAFKDLTDEELKNGKAVELANKIWANQAKEIADLTMSSEKAKGAIGDLFEVIGKFSKPAIDTLNEKIKSLAVTAQNVINDLDSYLDQQLIGKKVANAFTTGVQDLRASGNSSWEIEQKTRDIILKMDEKDLDITEAYLSNLKTRTTDEQTVLDILTKQRQEREKWAKQDAARAKSSSSSSSGSSLSGKSDDEKALEMINATKAQIAAQEKALDLEAKLGNTTVDNADLLNIYTSAYVDLISQSGGLVKETNSYSKELLATIEKLAATQSDSNEEWEKNRLTLVDSLGSDESIEELKKDIQIVNDLIEEANQEGVDISSDLWATYYEKREDMEEKLQQLIKEKTQETIENVLNTMNEFVSAASDIASSMSDVITTEAEARKDKAETILQEQYDNALISEDEYNAQKEQIEKEYAQKEYEAEMWQWTASLAQIGTNTAVAITEAWTKNADNIGLATALTAVYSALGAAQLAAAIANKPVPPSYATGGVIGGMNGATLGGDNTYAHVRTGEMVLNAAQQRALWAVANGNGSASGGNVYVRNYAGNDVSVQPQLTEDGVKIMIRKTVSSQLKKGMYNSELSIANNTMHGVRYTS